MTDKLIIPYYTIYILNKQVLRKRKEVINMSKLVEANKKIEKTVVGGYKKIEKTVVEGYKKIEDKFVDKFLKKDDETIQEAKERVKKEQKELEKRRDEELQKRKEESEKLINKNNI